VGKILTPHNARPKTVFLIKKNECDFENVYFSQEKKQKIQITEKIYFLF